MHFYKSASNTRPLASIVPAVQYVKAMEGTMPVKVWPVSTRGRKRSLEQDGSGVAELPSGDDGEMDQSIDDGATDGDGHATGGGSMAWKKDLQQLEDEYDDNFNPHQGALPCYAHIVVAS